MSSNSVDTDVEIAQQNLPANASSEIDVAGEPTEDDQQLEVKYQAEMKKNSNISVAIISTVFVGVIQNYIIDLNIEDYSFLLAMTLVPGMLLMFISQLRLRQSRRRQCQIALLSDCTRLSIFCLMSACFNLYSSLLGGEFPTIIFSLLLVSADMLAPHHFPANGPLVHGSEDKLKQSSKLAAQLIYLGFGGTVGILSGYEANAKVQTLNPWVIYPLSFATLGSLIMCWYTYGLQMPNCVGRITRSHLLVLNYLAYPSAFFLVLIEVAISKALLHDLGWFLLLPILAVAVTVYYKEVWFGEGNLNAGDAEELENARGYSYLVTTAAFMGVTRTSAIYHSATKDQFLVQVSLFFLLSAVVTGQASAMLIFQFPNLRSSIPVVRYLNLTSLGLVIMVVVIGCFLMPISGSGFLLFPTSTAPPTPLTVSTP